MQNGTKLKVSVLLALADLSTALAASPQDCYGAAWYSVRLLGCKDYWLKNDSFAYRNATGRFYCVPAYARMCDGFAVLGLALEHAENGKDTFCRIGLFRAQAVDMFG